MFLLKIKVYLSNFFINLLPADPGFPMGSPLTLAEPQISPKIKVSARKIHPESSEEDEAEDAADEEKNQSETSDEGEGYGSQ